MWVIQGQRRIEAQEYLQSCLRGLIFVSCDLCCVQSRFQIFIPTSENCFGNLRCFSYQEKKPGDPGWSIYVGVLRRKSNSRSRMPVGLHMRCIRSLFNVLYRFEIFFSTSENCFGKLTRCSNQEKKSRGCGGSTYVGNSRPTLKRSSRTSVDLLARPYNCIV